MGLYEYVFTIANPKPEPPSAYSHFFIDPGKIVSKIGQGFLFGNSLTHSSGHPEMALFLLNSLHFFRLTFACRKFNWN